MATLAEIFGEVPQIAFKDDKGVYLDGEQIALSNSSNNGYIRRNGTRTLEEVDACSGLHNSELPLKFVGAAPGADPLKLEIATLAALVNQDHKITNVVIDKNVIAESEGIKMEDLTKFDGVAMVSVDYIVSKKEFFDPKCDYDIC